MSEKTMPVAELRTLTDDVEGSVRFSKAYQNLHWVAKADLLRDWVYALQQEYEALLGDPNRYEKRSRTAGCVNE